MTPRRVPTLFEALGIRVPHSDASNAFLQSKSGCPEKRESEVVSIVGGGGKTSALFSLLDGFSCRGLSALALTTTRMAVPTGPETVGLSIAVDGDPAGPLSLALENPGRRILASSSAFEHTSPGDRIQAKEKISGYGADAVDRAARLYGRVNLIVEADGSRGLPLKAPAGHEPVIPAETTLVLVLVGADALLKPLSPDTVHRFELFLSVSRVSEGTVLDPHSFGRVLMGPSGYGGAYPEGCRVCLAANRSDLLNGREREAALRFLKDLSGLLPELSGIILCSIKEGIYDIIV